MRKTFEYRLMPVIESSAGSSTNRVQTLIDAGREGWELVSVSEAVPNSTDGQCLFHLYFKREAEEPKTRPAKTTLGTVKFGS